MASTGSRISRSRQAVQRRQRRRRRELLGSAGRDLYFARAVGLRQDDDACAWLPDWRNRTTVKFSSTISGRGAGTGSVYSAGKAPAGNGLSILRHLAASDRFRKRRISLTSAARVGRDNSSARAITRWKASVLADLPIAARRSFPAANNSASRWRGRWSMSRRSYCSTNRFRISTRNCASRCASRFAPCSANSILTDSLRDPRSDRSDDVVRSHRGGESRPLRTGGLAGRGLRKTGDAVCRASFLGRTVALDGSAQEISRRPVRLELPWRWAHCAWRAFNRFVARRRGRAAASRGRRISKFFRRRSLHRIRLTRPSSKLLISATASSTMCARAGAVFRSVRAKDETATPVGATVRLVVDPRA